MPLVDISIARGRSSEQLRDLIKEVHEAVERSVGATPENITVIVREVEPHNWSRANRTVEERAARIEIEEARPTANSRSTEADGPDHSHKF